MRRAISGLAARGMPVKLEEEGCEVYEKVE